MPELADVEKRLRIAEQDLAEHKGEVKRMVDDIKFIRERMEDVSVVTGKFGQIDAIERSATAAHQRIDKLAKIETEHELCKKVSEKETMIISNLSEKVGAVQSMVTSLQSEFSHITKREEDVKGFWTRRLEKFIDTFAPMLTIAIIVMLVMNFYGKPAQQIITNMDVNSQQDSKIKDLTEKLNKIQPAPTSTP